MFWDSSALVPLLLAEDRSAALTAELVADARAAGITEVTALVASENTAAVSLLRRALGRLDVRFEGTELSVRAALT